MGYAAPATLLSNANAAQWNRDVMLEFQAALEKNPAADLMSIFSDSYLQEHRNAQYRQLSYAAKINFRVLDELSDTLRHEPEVNLLSAFPKNYSRRIKMATGPKLVSDIEQQTEREGPPEFRTRLDLAETATVVYPSPEKRQSHFPVPKARRPLQRVYMVFWGPNREDVGDEKYFLSLEKGTSSSLDLTTLWC